MTTAVEEREEAGTDTLAAALLKLQEHPINAKQSERADVVAKNGAKFGYDYATLEDCWDAARDRLNEAGLVPRQRVYRETDGQWLCATVLEHPTSGDRTDPVVLPILGAGTMQQLGSAITYARRYGLIVACNILTGDDDDGSRASAPPAQAPAPQPDRTPEQSEALDEALGHAAAIIDAGVFDKKRLLTEAVSLGAQDTSSITAAFSSMPPEAVEKLRGNLADLLGALEEGGK